uniref:ELMO domain-containing protein n=1 Tax=Xiphophorus couchianus TaxID=32473 RepID=A0A3B5MNW7_9TELE
MYYLFFSAECLVLHGLSYLFSTCSPSPSPSCLPVQLLRSALSVHPDQVEKTIDDIMALKKINPDTNPQLGVSLQASLLQIVGYRSLMAEVEKLRREPYDSENAEHESMLMKLWKELRPDTPLTRRISKQWCEIGFQGNDPKTDFRGMGLLGLQNLLYFAEHDRAAALQMLQDSLQPKHKYVGVTLLVQTFGSDPVIVAHRLLFPSRYSFAIVGINITDLAYSLLVSGALKTHLYNVAPEMAGLQHFQQIFCYLMQEFQRFWIEEDPSDIMEFNRVRSKFHRRILRQLKNPDMALCPHFSASDLHLVNL